ncbi:hypothetical protein AgCh_009051 [Apium graveolens]
MEWVLQELKQFTKDCPQIYSDNNSAIALSKDPIFHGKSQHIRIKYHFIRDLVKNKDINVNYCKTGEQRTSFFSRLKNEREESSFLHENSDTKNEESVLVMFSEQETYVDNIWYVDSGCSHHMTGNKTNLINLDKSVQREVKTGDDKRHLDKELQIRNTNLTSVEERVTMPMALASGKRHHQPSLHSRKGGEGSLGVKKSLVRLQKTNFTSILAIVRIVFHKRGGENGDGHRNQPE